MLDNLIVNIRTILPIAKANDSRDDNYSGNYANESAIAFLEQSSNRDTQDNNTNRTMLNIVRSYFSQLYSKKSVTDVDNDIMLPRVYDYADLKIDWDPVELRAKEKLIEDIDNVIDKFVRVITVNETESPRRDEMFYVLNIVFILLTNFHFKVKFLRQNRFHVNCKCNDFLKCVFIFCSET